MLMEHSGEDSTNETNSLAIELKWFAPLELDMFWNAKRADRVQNTNRQKSFFIQQNKAIPTTSFIYIG